MSNDYLKDVHIVLWCICIFSEWNNGWRIFKAGGEEGLDAFGLFVGFLWPECPTVSCTAIIMRLGDL